MARCGCGSAGATGAAMGSTNCISVTGAGTALDPFVPELVLDPASDNLLVCGADGLYARAQVQAPADESMVLTPGAVEGDYDYAVQISVAAGNGLQLNDDGLYAKPNPILITATPLFGVLPADPAYLHYGGQVVDTTNVDGRITIPIYPDIDGIVTIVYSLADTPAAVTNHAMENATLSLDSFSVIFTDDANAPIVGGTYRLTYMVTAWYTP